ncbi:hypothetical protein B0H14DRAFT_3501577 [Mycena olivaceomarginata]|nr:hypothetical protein B0H14DRAFT_3501577 [Mycena olivaceomarginata]
MRPTSSALLLAAATLAGAYHSPQNATHPLDYSIHLPSSYGSTKAYSLVLCFYGSSSVGVLRGLGGSKYNADGVGGAWAGASYPKATVPENL